MKKGLKVIKITEIYDYIVVLLEVKDGNCDIYKTVQGIQPNE